MTDPKHPEHPQWRRRRYWNMAGAGVALLGFIASGVAVVTGEASEHVVAFAWCSSFLFLTASGIYVGTALLRPILGKD